MKKLIVIFNAYGYYDKLIDMLEEYYKTFSR